MNPFLGFFGEWLSEGTHCRWRLVDFMLTVDILIALNHRAFAPKLGGLDRQKVAAVRWFDILEKSHKKKPNKKITKLYESHPQTSNAPRMKTLVSYSNYFI